MLPKDPFMLLSYVNTQLRDNYESLEELCSSLGVSKDSILEGLSKAGFKYDESLNKFIGG
ncbi:MAG: DUF4250 domain-containing protein [Saccharofermentans sp.]|nr:DUF4250 domain-containing protein [Saccharofermentans sp.]